MNKILSVEQVADILGLRPFTVRKMFREGRLTGFKVGKAWRTTEDDLRQDIARMRTGSPAGTASPVQPPVPSTSTAPAGGMAPGEKPPPSKGPLPRPRGVGRLIVFSKVSGQEVYLDGERRGITTLSILDVSEGRHRLQVGSVEGVIEVEADMEHRVTAQEDTLDIRTRALTSPLTRVHLTLQIDNKSLLEGQLRLHLLEAREGEQGDLFAEYPEYVPGTGLTLETPLARDTVVTLFDGPLRAAPNTALLVMVPRQPGIEREIRQAYPAEGAQRITVTLADGGLLRSRPILRIRSEVVA